MAHIVYTEPYREYNEEFDSYEDYPGVYEVQNAAGQCVERYYDENNPYDEDEIPAETQAKAKLAELQAYERMPDYQDQVYQDLSPLFRAVEKEGLDRKPNYKFIFNGTNKTYNDTENVCRVPGYSKHMDDKFNLALEEGISKLNFALKMRGVSRPIRDVHRFGGYSDPYYRQFNPQKMDHYGDDDCFIRVPYSVDQFPNAPDMIQEIRNIVSWKVRPPTDEEILEIVDKYTQAQPDPAEFNYDGNDY